MAVIRTRIEGADALDRLLKQLPEKVARNVLRGAVRKGAKVVEAEMRQRAPVGPTGNLKASITQRGVKTKDKRMLTRRVGSFKGGGLKGYHAHFIEFGTVKMAARPFLRPAWDQTKGEALKVMGKELGRGIEKAALKLAGPFAKSGLGRKRRR